MALLRIVLLFAGCTIFVAIASALYAGLLVLAGSPIGN